MFCISEGEHNTLRIFGLTKQWSLDTSRGMETRHRKNHLEGGEIKEWLKKGDDKKGGGKEE